LGWLVYDMTGSGAMLGLINLVRSGAIVGLNPFTGAAIDRAAPRPLLVAINGWLLIITFVLGIG
jgi:hypothetical protein